MCLNNSPSVCCGIPISEYRGRPKAGRRFCLLVKANILYLMVRYNITPHQSGQRTFDFLVSSALDSCNMNQGTLGSGFSQLIWPDFTKLVTNLVCKYSIKIGLVQASVEQWLRSLGYSNPWERSDKEAELSTLTSRMAELSTNEGPLISSPQLPDPGQALRSLLRPPQNHGFNAHEDTAPRQGEALHSDKDDMVSPGKDRMEGLAPVPRTSLHMKDMESLILANPWAEADDMLKGGFPANPWAEADGRARDAALIKADLLEKQTDEPLGRKYDDLADEPQDDVAGRIQNDLAGRIQDDLAVKYRDDLAESSVLEQPHLIPQEGVETFRERGLSLLTHSEALRIQSLALETEAMQMFFLQGHGNGFLEA